MTTGTHTYTSTRARVQYAAAQPMWISAPATVSVAGEFAMFRREFASPTTQSHTYLAITAKPQPLSHLVHGTAIFAACFSATGIVKN